ncbi:hypothetical protein CFBP6600_32620 [Xanthomonas arboricola pv. corylina]|uniref:hypothetical protein n=1 Tax=Xanthomonas arboricola TaxID=56448 RepID=UPI000CEEDA1C|nr:hypothetical protein [Xanthomonas arboricola]PPU14536.1 hypothetical protein XacyCFBP2565_13100 [Xanthomonas arboricola pv. corylina]UQQ13307.1 hypothetical protein KPG65_11955 [Xanthomonas arboricola pv. corylina]CAE6817945.1 hypothetical protein CFBP6600_32620 [Xanthomonas arboricola pv. corylina]CAE6817969.1 hypothetical protein CFBP6600_32620 [Xanthomonas arboricola pv. corylina]
MYRTLDDALAAHRQAHGEPEQIQHAQRVDPCDAVPSSPAERYKAYVSQRRYAVRAYFGAGKHLEDMARVLGVPVHTIRKDLATMHLRHLRHLRHQRLLSPTLAGCTPAEIQGLLTQGLTQGKLAKRLRVSQQAVSQFCMANGLTNPAQAQRQKKISERQEMVRLLSAEGLSIGEMAERVGVPTHVVSRVRVNLKLPRRKTPIDEFTLLGLSRAEVQRLLMQFEAVGALARHLNTSSPLVSKYLKRVELKAPRDDRGKHRLKR